MERKESFNYTYSAKERQEIESIRKKYEAPKRAEDKMTRLRRMDQAVIQKATMVGLIFGILGALLLGMGMSLAMTEIGQSLGLSAGLAMLAGIPLGILGIALVSAAYPLYSLVLKKERQRIAPEILRLSDELMK